MKIIILLLLLLTAIFASGQTDFRSHAKYVVTIARIGDRGELSNAAASNAKDKIKALKTILILDDAQVKVLDDLFKKQFVNLQSASDSYYDSKSESGKKSLIEVLVKNEEEFRDALTDEQLKIYLAADYKKRSKSLDLINNFFTDPELEEYKNLLKVRI